ncbi:aminomethyl-transferring glycine dehydrogenase [Alginatibacterium sediminis]|uniref:Glycine dehydrogenase (decarboxylating) n=1 Tax=Alginatibacterium sediminis TaxID=2164068 RepID=A0A420EDD2_9ALTE|nr:aminomethyl-transferring glycine dehydrogenase [Alginatibacterium sediminis]RKF18676.1 aminomethyl-transferring glycine dehydrogenase [Alginatibacterium sediminis]
MSSLPLSDLEQNQDFIRRHIGPTAPETAQMLEHLNVSSLDELINQTVPEDIRLHAPLAIDESLSEQAALAKIRKIAQLNKVNRSYIGMGYHNTHVPNVILRNVFENPGWYTAYTPYQPEIAQGRLEALLNFQQMTLDLTGLELASASLLDEATAAAEAMALAKRVSKNRKSNLYFVANDVHPQTVDVVHERADFFGFEIVRGDAAELEQHNCFGALLQYPGTSGEITDLAPIIAAAQAKKSIVAVSADILALVLLKSPGALGADVVLGSAQRFGVPMGYGGPHAAFFATRDAYKRSLPGRIIGVSKDRRGNNALRMALQTREQHIRREKANSNICTAQVLLANMASFYAVFHGPTGLKTIANRVHRLTKILALGLKQHAIKLRHEHYFDTLCVELNNSDEVNQRALALGMNLRTDFDGALGVSLDETTTIGDVCELLAVFVGPDNEIDAQELDLLATEQVAIPSQLERDTPILEHEVFNRYSSETDVLRYIKRLESKDLALNHSMISLGSCTMKLNATAEMIPVSWPEFGSMHPFCPSDQAQGYKQLIDQLEDWLVEVTGYDSICMQPNSGAQGEYAGLLAIQKYHASRGDHHRNICLIPSSAHGTNPASAQMAGLKVVVTACDEHGNVDMVDLRNKAEELADSLSCIMITYPSTHGVYEETIREICDLVHEHGGQVYMDGANMNAQVGLTSPGFIGSDVSHLNLHKTFAIPHGGGGPGMGPIGVKSHLAPFVAGHSVISNGKQSASNPAVSAAPYGSASILPISWMYLAMLGREGAKNASEYAILNANYLAKRLSGHFPILYTGKNGRVAHECIIDMRPLKEATGITEMDVAKRLNDYGFHAPTMSFPVAGTLMVEPTESESKREIDRFIDAMISIRQEIAKVESGEWTLEDNPLVFAPHVLDDLTDANWEHSYSRELAVFPSDAVRSNKFWPTVSRIDDVFGDRNLFCACLPMEAYE